MSRDIPIIFSAPMVQALLAGRKLMTRRLLYTRKKAKDGVIPNTTSFLEDHPPPTDLLPFGEYWKLGRWHLTTPGDRLYVRESFRVGCGYDGVRAGELPTPDVTRIKLWFEADRQPSDGAGKLRPPIFFPRWASRLTLVVTATKIEKLADISHDDAVAEGCYRIEPCAEYPHGNAWGRAGFASLWNSLHGKGSFGAQPSPEVVALTFTVHQTNIDQMKVAA